MPSPKSVAKTILGLAWQMADRLVLPWLPRPRPRGPTLLLLRLDRIGDMVVWLAAAQLVIGHFKASGHHVVVIVAPECAVLLRDISGIDEILTIDRAALLLRPLYRLRSLARVRALGATLVIHPTFSRVAALGDALVRASGAARRVGWVGDGASSSRFEQRWGDSAYTELLPDLPGLSSEITRNEALPGLLGIKPPSPAPVPLPRTPVSGLPRSFYVLAPGASQELKRWPVERFAALAGRLHAATGWTGIVCGGGGDRPLAAGLLRAAGDVPLIDMTGATDLPALADLIAQARLVVSCDSAAIHIAASVRTPGIGISGGGGHGRFLPYPPLRLAPVTPPLVAVQPRPCFGCDWKCPYRPLGNDPAPCIEDVSVEMVWEKVEEVLAGL